MSDAASSVLPSATPAAADSAITVLVVDDYHAGLYAKSHTLQQAGFRVLEATTGTDALRIVAEHRPAVVVLDVRLPDLNGIEVCRAIKQDPANAGVIVLQVSAFHTSTEDQVHGLNNGADCYIPGDIDPSLLLASVRALLRGRGPEGLATNRADHGALSRALDQSREEIRALAASLLTAQEEERRRIARELHDDLSQRVAVLELELANVRDRPADLDARLSAILAQISGLSTELRNLSHALHPAIVEDLGLEPALRSLCEAFERNHPLGAECTCVIDTRRIPAPTATVIYRIAQEALRNVANHAGDARVTITLSGDAEGFSLTIVDDGCGFEPSVPRSNAGLGLISMQERAALIGGRLEVHSAPGQGTTVKLWAPWPLDAGAVPVN
jgi:signal transduction histidine kinase